MGELNVMKLFYRAPQHTSIGDLALGKGNNRISGQDKATESCTQQYRRFHGAFAVSSGVGCDGLQNQGKEWKMRGIVGGTMAGILL